MHAQRVGKTIGWRCKSKAISASFAIVGQVCTTDDACSASKRQASGERAKETRFPRSIGADQAKPGSRRHKKVDVMNDARTGSVDRCAAHLNCDCHLSNHVTEAARRYNCHKIAKTSTGNNIGTAIPASTTIPQMLISVSAARFG